MADLNAAAAAAAAAVPPAVPPADPHLDALMRLGFTEPTANAIIDLGFTNFNQLAAFNRETLSNLFKGVAAKAQKQAANVSEANRIRPNIVGQANLEALIYWVKSRKAIGETVTAEEVNEDLAQEWAAQKERDDRTDEVHKTNQSEAPKFKQESDWPKFKEHFESVLFTTRGVSLAPVAYVVRDSVAPPADGTVFDGLDDRRIQCTPHDGEDYRQDNGIVFDMLDKILSECKGAYAHIRKFKKKRDGRAAWMALCRYYDGDAHSNKRATVAKNTIENLVFDGKRRFTFDKFVEEIKNAHVELESPDVNDPYTEKRKVEKLCQNIKDARLSNALEHVLTNAKLNANFDAAVDHLSKILNFKSTTEAGGRTISQVQQVPGDGGKRGKKRKGSFVPKSKWNKMTDAQKQAVFKKREEEKAKNRIIKEMQSKIASLEKKFDGQGNGDEQKEDDAAPRRPTQPQFGSAAHQRN